MIRKIFRVGNSVCVTLDKKMLRELNMDSTLWVAVEIDKRKGQFIIRKKKDNEW